MTININKNNLSPKSLTTADAVRRQIEAFVKWIGGGND